LERSLHTNGTLSTAFLAWVVKEVGKQGQKTSLTIPLSKNPELHSLILEKRTLNKNA
jgi:hypothetical protein